AVAETRQVPWLSLVMQDREVHGRYPREKRDPVALDHPKRLLGRKAGEQREGATGCDARVLDAGLTEGVEEWQRRERHMVIRDGQHLRYDHRTVQEQVRVRELGAFGLAGRARGVEDDRGIRGF